MPTPNSPPIRPGLRKPGITVTAKQLFDHNRGFQSLFSNYYKIPRSTLWAYLSGRLRVTERVRLQLVHAMLHSGISAAIPGDPPCEGDLIILWPGDPGYTEILPRFTNKPEIYDWLKERGWNIARLVDAVGFSRRQVDAVLHGRFQINKEDFFLSDFAVMNAIATVTGVLDIDIPWTSPDQRHAVRNNHEVLKLQGLINPDGKIDSEKASRLFDEAFAKIEAESGQPELP